MNSAISVVIKGRGRLLVVPHVINGVIPVLIARGFPGCSQVRCDTSKNSLLPLTKHEKRNAATQLLPIALHQLTT